jgi:hypothetical protein
VSRGRWARRLACASTAAVAVVLVLASAPGCGQASHLLIGQVYDSARGCLARPTAIDVIAGDDPGRCSPECLEGPALAGGAGAVVYVTSMCGPYPALDAPSRSAECVAALGAFAQNSLCSPDGGTTLGADARFDAR